MNIQEEVLHEQISYWKEELAGAPTKLELPTDKPRPAVQSFRVATETFELPKELLEQLRTSATGASHPFHDSGGRLHGLAAPLYRPGRYSGGNPGSRRTPVEIESTLNRVHNTVVLRSRFTEHLNFRSLLQQMRERTLGAYAHSDLPFEQVVAELAPERDPSHAPVFQVMFVLHDAEEVSQIEEQRQRVAEGRNLGIRPDTLHLRNRKWPQGTVEYSADIFEAATIQRLCGHYGTLLKAIARDPDQSIAKLPMLTERERTQILHEWNDTAQNIPQVCVHELFEQQASLHPDAIALVFEDRQLTYRELNERANQVAHYLRKRGVGPEVLVGVCLERCPEMLVALLGIWKAGGAYVPLDPAYPMERLSFMVKDAAVKVLLTDNKHQQLFPSANDQAICLDSDWPVIAQESTSNLEPAATPSNLAYVMYTSGSTGTAQGSDGSPRRPGELSSPGP